MPKGDCRIEYNDFERVSTKELLKSKAQEQRAAKAAGAVEEEEALPRGGPSIAELEARLLAGGQAKKSGGGWPFG